MIKVVDLFQYIAHPRRILNKNTFDNEHFVAYLKRNGVMIGEGTRFISPSRCSIDIGRGDYISIGSNCCFSLASIIAHDYSWYVLLESHDDLVPDPGQRVVIGNNCFIGFESVILKGTEIGDNVIIGARSVVRGKIPSNTVWAGVPAKQICTLDDYYAKKVESKLEDAIYRRDHIIMKKGRNPYVQEMGLFAVLFLQRTEENYEKYIQNIEFNGIKDNVILKNYFYNTNPMFKSFDDFLQYGR